MRMINLIAQERQRKQQMRRRVRLFEFLLLGFLGVVLSGYGAVYLYLASCEAQQRSLQAELMELQPVLAQIEITTRQIESLQPQLTILKRAETDTARWQRLLDYLSRHTPSSLWLSTLRTGDSSDRKGPLLLTLGGLAANQKLVGELMLHLNNCPDLSQIELRFTQEQMLNAFTSGVDFEIGAALKGTEILNPSKEAEPDGGTDSS